MLIIAATDLSPALGLISSSRCHFTTLLCSVGVDLNKVLPEGMVEPLVDSWESDNITEEKKHFVLLSQAKSCKAGSRERKTHFWFQLIFPLNEVMPPCLKPSTAFRSSDIKSRLCFPPHPSPSSSPQPPVLYPHFSFLLCGAGHILPHPLLSPSSVTSFHPPGLSLNVSPQRCLPSTRPKSDLSLVTLLLYFLHSTLPEWDILLPVW